MAVQGAPPQVATTAPPVFMNSDFWGAGRGDCRVPRPAAGRLIV
jgi:hypothetical protein